MSQNYAHPGDDRWRPTLVSRREGGLLAQLRTEIGKTGGVPAADEVAHESAAIRDHHGRFGPIAEAEALASHGGGPQQLRCGVRRMILGSFLPLCVAKVLGSQARFRRAERLLSVTVVQFALQTLAAELERSCARRC